MQTKRLLMFYEENCDPCVVMEPLITKLEKELNVIVTRLEVWNNQENKKLLEKYAGFSIVPFFYNENTRSKISGETDFDTLESWALGDNID